MKQSKPDSKIVIYQTKKGNVELRGDIKNRTIWASQSEIVRLFNVDQSVISRHIRNIFKDGEISEKSNMQKMHITSSDKPVFLYSLDVILAVGYRANSGRAIEFRKWATKILHRYITEGFAINSRQVVKNYQNFLNNVDDIKKLISKNINIDNENILELVKMFASTWLSLDAYDKDKLNTKGYTKKKVALTVKNLTDNLEILKKELIFKKEASDLFARESKNGNLSAIIGNVMQAFGGKDLYPTIEEKAANLFYLIIKNHPFVDGNKRSGAYAFIWFLNKARVLDSSKITPPALTALTILIAESNPKEKEKMIGLILTILGKRS